MDYKGCHRIFCVLSSKTCVYYLAYFDENNRVVLEWLATVDRDAGATKGFMVPFFTNFKSAPIQNPASTLGTAQVESPTEANASRLPLSGAPCGRLRRAADDR